MLKVLLEFSVLFLWGRSEGHFLQSTTTHLLSVLQSPDSLFPQELSLAQRILMFADLKLTTDSEGGVQTQQSTSHTAWNQKWKEKPLRSRVQRLSHLTCMASDGQ